MRKQQPARRYDRGVRTIHGGPDRHADHAERPVLPHDPRRDRGPSRDARARSHGDLESGPLKSVADKLVTALEGQGLSGFGAEGDEFDPALHEAVQHEGDGTHPVVGTVMRRGYKVGDLVVRHALVGVVDTVPEDEGQPVEIIDAEPEQAAESTEQDN